MTISELMVILEAAKRGERTQMFMDEQWKYFNVEEWVKLFAPFRVSPEPRKPREWKLLKMSEDRWMVADDLSKNYCAIDVVFVREVLENE